MNELTLEAITSNSFLLNLDESSGNNKKRLLGVLANYYVPEFDKVVLHCQTAIG